MGASSSKARAIRKLPASSTLPRSTPSAPPPQPPPSSAVPRETSLPEQAEQVEQAEQAPLFDYGSRRHTQTSGSGPGPRASNEARGGMGKVQFTGEKDDAIKQDAMDPQFMRNLGQLGQVQIHDAGEFVPVQAQRTLLSRSPTYTSPDTTPPKHLHMPLLISLLDRLKTLPPGSDPSSLYAEYGVDKSTMEIVRRWVNSVSVGEHDEVRVEEGEEVREMKAVWVGGVGKAS